MDERDACESLVARVARIAAESPERAAVVDADGSLSYRELDGAANALAAKIPLCKRPGDTFVVVMLPRTRQFPVAALAALKAGAAFVPVSPSYPADRVNDILGQTPAALFVTTSEIWNARKGELSVAADAVIRTDELPDEGPAVDASAPEKAAMVLFTSGTTGRPKGVVHTLASVTAIGRASAADGARQYALVADFGFIAAAYILFESLWTGGTCHVVDEETRLDLVRLAAYFTERKIDVAFLGSSLGAELLKGFDVRLAELRLGGEKVPAISRETLAGRRVLDYYGLSEMAPIAAHVLTGDEESVPVGRPVGDCRLYVLDEALRETAAGTVGDVYAASPRMAREYLGLADESAARFVGDPFAAGGKMLKTGDRGFIDAAGELVLCGRSDFMVKLRGQRIETGEIETVAQAFPETGSCVCVVKPVNGADQLCLYYEGTADAETLRRHLVAKLAGYMVPARLVRLEKLPRNARGKVDRSWLPDPVSNCKAEMVPPASDNERMLLDLARRQMGYDKFGVTDDLFAFGLTSLGAMNLAAEAGKLKIRLKASAVMAGKSVRGALQHDMEPVWWYRKYDPEKDVALFVHGVALTKNIDRKLQLWAERWNVLVVEPTIEHYGTLVPKCPIGELVARYHELVAARMPAEAKLAVATGVSWGGKLAYMIADLWRAKTGQLPTVVMGDTLLTGEPTLFAAIQEGTLPAWEKAHNLTLNPDFIRRLAMMLSIEKDGVDLPHYPGRTYLLHALKFQFPGDNAALWKDIAPDLTVVPVEGIHEDIALDTDKTLPIWRKVAEEIG